MAGAAACSLFLSTDELSDPPAPVDAASNADVVGPSGDGSSDPSDAGSDVSTDAPATDGGFNLGCNANGLVAAWMFDEAKGLPPPTARDTVTTRC